MDIARLSISGSLAVVSVVPAVTIAWLADLDLLTISLLKSGDLLPDLNSLCGAGLLRHQLAGHHSDGLQLLETGSWMVIAMVAVPRSRGAQGGDNGTKQNNNLINSKIETRLGMQIIHLHHLGSLHFCS